MVMQSSWMLSGLPAPRQSQKVSSGVGRGLPVGSEAGGEGKISLQSFGNSYGVT